MSETPTGASTRASRVMRAQPEEIYRAFMDAAALAAWLPPGEMTGTGHQFHARDGGGYRVSLFYPAAERDHRGKTSDHEDMVTVRFVGLVPARKIVGAVTFHAADPALRGEMTIVATCEQVPGGTEVTFACTNL